jgi:long-subunit acyl-CoA synthetase (AMP-forming)/phosphate starvation-inducible protein PhoH
MGKGPRMSFKAGQARSESRTLVYLIDVLAERGDRQAVLALQKEGTESWSYSDLAEHARRLAHGLGESGVSRGNPVALLSANRPELIVACLAVVGCGAVATPVDVQLGDEALGRVLDFSGAKVIFTTADQTERLERLDIEVSPKPILLDVGEEDHRSWRHLLAEEVSEAELARPEPDEPAALFYTSGTTGAPKGVPLSHANLAFQIDAILGADIVTEDDRMLVPLPLHHVYPFVMGMLVPLALGLTIVLPHSLIGPQIVRALKEGEVSVIAGVPRLYSALYSGIARQAKSSGRLAGTLFGISAGLSTWVRRRTGLDAGKILMHPLRERLGPRLQTLASGGAPLDPDLAHKLEGMGWRIAIGYGLTETAPLLTLKPPDGKKLASVGRSMPGIDVRIDRSAMPDEDPERRKEGRWTDEPHVEGEILARGPGVFSGYRNLPKETEEAFTEDGWFRTKDLGYFDEGGYLYVTGRASTLIVTEGGKNVQPEEVEEAYLEDPIIREVGVLQKDSRLVAVIVPALDEIRRCGAEIDRAANQERYAQENVGQTPRHDVPEADHELRGDRLRQRVVERPLAHVLHQLRHVGLDRRADDAPEQDLDPESIHLRLQESGLEDLVRERDEPGEEVTVKTRRGQIRGRGPAQRQYMLDMQRHDLSFGIGPAGTGKTYLAVASAVHALENEEVRRLVLVRPAGEAGDRLGFLPGDLAQKVDPYLRPMYDALYEMLGFERVARLIERSVIEVAPLAFMRGRTLNESFVILDEAQNTTVEQMKMFLTRIGFGSRAVVTGDVTQIDLPRDTTSGLRHAIEVLKDIDDVSFTFFTAGDVVRHPLVQRIVSAYERHSGSE